MVYYTSCIYVCICMLLIYVKDIIVIFLPNVNYYYESAFT